MNFAHLWGKWFIEIKEILFEYVLFQYENSQMLSKLHFTYWSSQRGSFSSSSIACF
jgi:hypothetical protein